MKAYYIETVKDITPGPGRVMGRHHLSDFDLVEIGEFTRGNILRWFEKGIRTPDPIEAAMPEDFHAVCGEIDIPWDKEESRLAWERCFPTGDRNLSNLTLADAQHILMSAWQYLHLNEAPQNDANKTILWKAMCAARAFTGKARGDSNA